MGLGGGLRTGAQSRRLDGRNKNNDQWLVGLCSEELSEPFSEIGLLNPYSPKGLGYLLWLLR